MNVPVGNGVGNPCRIVSLYTNALTGRNWIFRVELAGCGGSDGVLEMGKRTVLLSGSVAVARI